jgi:hypothetical protein
MAATTGAIMEEVITVTTWAAIIAAAATISAVITVAAITSADTAAAVIGDTIGVIATGATIAIGAVTVIGAVIVAGGTVAGGRTAWARAGAGRRTMIGLCGSATRTLPRDDACECASIRNTNGLALCGAVFFCAAPTTRRASKIPPRSPRP